MVPQQSFGRKLLDSLRAFFVFLWGFLRGLGPKFLGFVVLIGSLVLGYFLLKSKVKGLGGLLGGLLGGDKPTSVISEANTVDPQRTTPIGEPDSRGITQAIVVPIEPPGILSDPKRVTIVEPKSEVKTEVVLPDGVTRRDVDEVVIVRPRVVEVEVKDSSPVTPKKVTDLLKKYQR